MAAAGSSSRTRRAEAFSFEPAEGCAVYPEVETSATGTPFTSATPWAR